MRTVPVLTPAQSRAWDASAEAAGIPTAMLMGFAGRAVATIVLDRFAGAATQGTLVACGTGNNGGDGWATARTLHALGVPVWVTEVAAPAPGIAADARASALHDGVRLLPHDGPWPGISLVLDSLLGTGASGAPREQVAALMHRIADLRVPVIAVDGPTGIDLGNGVDHGALRAVCTVTFGGARRGHLLARDEIGDLVIVDIGLPPADRAWPVLVSSAWAAERMPQFRATSHKGTRGRVVIIGGAPAMTGAARMTARGAFAAGAGLVHVMAPESALETLRMAEPDVQTMAQEFEGSLSDEAVELIAKADVIAIGPGLGRGGTRAAFVLDVLEHARAAVIDADALTVLRTERAALTRLAVARLIVCTPHIGEFRTLFPECAHDLETAPWDAAAAAAQACGATVLLKGVPTVVASAKGVLLTMAAGNPGLATGGSGDLLTGIIAALMAQKVEPVEAAAVGAIAHGLAADHAARRHTARAMRPMDVVTSLPEVWRAWGRSTPVPRAPILMELDAPRTV